MIRSNSIIINETNCLGYLLPSHPWLFSWTPC